MEKTILAIIPARGGSKGILKKNIRLLAGEPLINFTIRAALKSKYIHHTVVSTDDNEIRGIAVLEGATVIKRPYEISRDDSPAIDVILHALEQCENHGIYPEIVVFLQPTSPLRTSSDVDAALELFLHNECDSVISVVEVNHPPHWNMEIKGNYLSPLFGEKLLRKRRQELPQTYIPNGAIYIASTETLKINHSFYCLKTKPYIMAVEKSVDIDSLFDIFFAEALIKWGREHHQKDNNC
jgi:CMP-N,N'-diacetyllegionaminic acid synthase